MPFKREWVEGVVPPIALGEKANSPIRSPYKLSITELIIEFGHTPERIELLRKFVAFRDFLCKCSIEKGFQWVDGSFLQDVENRESRSPNDIDVVTFFEQPLSIPPAEFALLLDKEHLKTEYSVDSYMEYLGKPLDEARLKRVSYWYSMWSHRKVDFKWKGFLLIPLAAAGDRDAHILLDAIPEGSHL